MTAIKLERIVPLDAPAAAVCEGEFCEIPATSVPATSVPAASEPSAATTGESAAR